MRSRIFALAMSLILLTGICCPAANASAESFLSTHKDEIADAIVTVRSNLESLGDDLAAIQEAVQARTADQKAGEESGGESNLADKLPDGLLDVVVSDIHDIDSDVAVEHDITVDNDFLNDNTIEHNWGVNVDNSRFNNNTIIRVRESTATRTPVSPASPGTATTTAPKTGDLNNVVLWIVIVAVSALALAAALFFLLRKKKK